MLDVLLRGGEVIDGTGGPRRRADVGIANGRLVVDPDRLRGEDTARTVDISGLIVAPGFIDIHTHYDAQLLWDPTASPSPWHGVTTVLGGNCGFSIAPLAPDDADYVKQMMTRVEGMTLDALEGGGAWDWLGFGEYLARLENNIAVNAGFLAGHSTLRRAVMGERATSETASPAELAAMQALLHDSLTAGALGFSSSLGEGHVDGAGRPIPSRAA